MKRVLCTLGVVAFLGGVCLLTASAQQGQNGQQQAADIAQVFEKASVNGKYAKLLKVVAVPKDEQQYGSFNDWGHWNGSSHAGFDNLPAGYWVYVAPHWFIWEVQNQGQGNKQAPAQASVNGKYKKLLKVIQVPGNQATYGQFNDWGYWAGTSWAGFDNLPQGYWVYVAPNWYIWEQENQQNQQGQ